jgi:hypothetical protein
MSLLDEIIAGASNDKVSTANLLRKVIVVSHRLCAAEIRQWAEHELNGYDADQDHLPAYRGPMPASAHARYAGPGGSSANTTLSSNNIPDWFQQFFEVTLRQPLAELEVAAAADEDPVIPWPGEAVVQWNRWEQDGTVPSIQYMNVLFASTVVSRMAVRGVIDRIRNSALTFALELQREFPNAGEIGGPTVADVEVQQVIHNITNNIHGDGVNIAIGSGNTQIAAVAPGDLIGFLQAVRELGIDGDELSELAAIVTSDDDPEVKRSRARAFADRIRAGSVVLGTELAATLVADGVIALVVDFLG